MAYYLTVKRQNKDILIKNYYGKIVNNIEKYNIYWYTRSVF